MIFLCFYRQNINVVQQYSGNNSMQETMGNDAQHEDHGTHLTEGVGHNC
jgi:hypothetical protein